MDLPYPDYNPFPGVELHALLVDELEEATDIHCVPKVEAISLEPDTNLRWADESETPTDVVPAAPQRSTTSEWKDFGKKDAEMRSTAARKSHGGSYGRKSERQLDRMYKETWRRSGVDENNRRKIMGVTREINILGSNEAAADSSIKVSQTPQLIDKDVGLDTEATADDSERQRKEDRGKPEKKADNFATGSTDQASASTGKSVSSKDMGEIKDSIWEKGDAEAWGKR